MHTDTLGDTALNATAHGHRHTLVLDAIHTAALAAHGSASVAREPVAHASFSPGKRPDMYLPFLRTALDVKTGGLFKSGLPPELAARAAHTPFAATADDFFATALGRPSRGAQGDGPFQPSDGTGYVPATQGEYAGALTLGTRVRVLASPKSPAPATPRPPPSSATPRAHTPRARAAPPTSPPTAVTASSPAMLPTSPSPLPVASVARSSTLCPPPSAA